MIGGRVLHDQWTCSTHLYSYFQGSLTVPSAMTYVFRPTKSYPLSAAMTGKMCHFPCLPECLVSVSICVRIDGFEDERKDQTVSIVLCQPVLRLQHYPELGMCPWWASPLKYKPNRTIEGITRSSTCYNLLCKGKGTEIDCL